MGKVERGNLSLEEIGIVRDEVSNIRSEFIFGCINSSIPNEFVGSNVYSLIKTLKI